MMYMPRAVRHAVARGAATTTAESTVRKRRLRRAYALYFDRLVSKVVEARNGPRATSMTFA
jgi:hypothetical protein